MPGTGLTSTLRVQGNVGGRANSFAVGLDANRAHFKHTNNTYAGSSGPVDPFHPVPGEFASDAPNLPRYRNSAEQYALFAEDHLTLSERWSVLGGLRHDRASARRRRAGQRHTGVMPSLTKQELFKRAQQAPAA